MNAPAPSPLMRYTDIITAKPSTAPAISATCGTLCVPWVTDSQCGT